MATGPGEWTIAPCADQSGRLDALKRFRIAGQFGLSWVVRGDGAGMEIRADYDTRYVEVQRLLLIERDMRMKLEGRCRQSDGALAETLAQNAKLKGSNSALNEMLTSIFSSRRWRLWAKWDALRLDKSA